MLGYKRTSHTSQTGLRCPCTPHPAFFPRTSWLRRAQILLPLVVIPALAPTLDKSLKGDRSLCPVHDVRASAASIAFQSGVSLEQILSAYHWKSHNTFTQFYFKDVAWADSELFHLGPVVAAQQVHHQTRK